MIEILDILKKIPEELSKRRQEQMLLQQRFENCNGEIVIYGHGNLGVELSKGLEHAGWPVKFFIDANQPTHLNTNVLNLRDANKVLSPKALIIVALYDIFSEYTLIQSDLHNEGFQNIISILDLRVWPELFQAGHIHSTIGWDIEHIPESLVFEAYSILDDSMSRQIYEELLHFTIDCPYKKLTLQLASDQYMPTDIYVPIETEHIVDCGAYDGDTMRAFFSAFKTWDSYTAIDADPYNVAKIQKSIQNDLPAGLQKKTNVLHAAVSNETGSVSFCAGNRTSSHIVSLRSKNDETISVPVVKLDDAVNGPVTLLKMDVEGFELRALQGAEGLIFANQPLLTICGYHRQADLWEIPLYMKKVLPHHHIYLRNYVGLIEYVFYAVPEDRVITHE